VDDILLASPPELLDLILETFNSFHDRLKFTMEIDEGGRISFLDVTLIVENQIIIFDLYKKPINFGRYLNFHSNYPMIHKKGVTSRVCLIEHYYYLTHGFIPRTYRKWL